MATLSTSSSLCNCKPSIITSSIPVAVTLRRRLPSTQFMFSSSRHPHHLFFLLSSNRYTKSAVRSAAVRPPPDSDPPPEKEPIRPSGFPVFLSKLQDRVQIFFAVLFWMSLFFWTSAWDGRNRPDKGSRFRR